MDGRLRVDDRLPTEAELAERFSVSRPTIREALKRLAAQNLIRSQRGPSGGTFVTHPSQEEARAGLAEATTLLVSMGEFDLKDIAEARLNIELECCKYAVIRRTSEHLSVMREEIKSQQAGISEEEFCASDVRFHRAFADATDNSLLQFIMATVIEALQPLSNMIIFQIRDRDKLVGYHAELLNAVEEKNADRAAKAIQSKMNYLTEQYKKAKRLKRSHKQAR
jgi:DNA-binding FadR family transcriptional regulator